MFTAFIVGLIVGTNFGMLVMAAIQISRQKEGGAEAPPWYTNDPTAIDR